MKRFLIFLCMLSLLTACAAKPQTETPPSGGEQTQAPDEPIVLQQLNVEFVKGERDTGALLELKKALPPLLTAALAQQGVTVESVAVTFGTSAEATARSLASGDVHIGFLPSSVYCAHPGEILAVADKVIDEPSSLIGLYLPYGEQNAALLEKLTSVPWGEAFSKADLIAAEWSVPANDEVAARYLSLLLGENYSLSLDELENLHEYADLAQRAEALKSANFVLVYGFETAANNFFATLDTLPLEGETVAVSAADETLAGEIFRAALQSALEALCESEDGQAALALYGNGEYVNYRAVDDAAYDTLRTVLEDTEE
ncbi:MAG: hypothetical protein IIX99_02130 [Oscillospiraceae bacterium]|nr:hypothetical protein [Oscillospiraceae bacterium]